jgi:hypothetical protein
MRHRGGAAAVALAVILAGCSSGEGADGGGSGAAEQETPPGVEIAEQTAFGRSNDEGVTVLVHAVEVVDDVIALELSVANPSPNDWVVAEDDDPALLLDTRGGTYPSRGEDVVARAGSRTRLRIEFAGPLGEGVDELVLRLNDDWAGSRQLDMEIRGIPVPGERRVELPDAEATTVAVEDVVAHHPNGTNVVVHAVTVGHDVVEVSFQAVNGGEDEVRLADLRSSVPDTRLREPGGRTLPLLAAEANTDLRIPGGQRLTGTLRFLGPLADSADRVSLEINSRGNATSESTRQPSMTINDIPVRR